MTSAYVLPLQKPAAAGTPFSKAFDWDDIHLRVKQPVNMASAECAISNDGTKIAFRGISDGKAIFGSPAPTGPRSRATPQATSHPTQIQWSKIFSTTIFFKDSKGNLRSATLRLARFPRPDDHTVSGQDDH